jgi:hypothetical protein
MRTTSDAKVPDENELNATFDAGVRIYTEKYKADFEARYPGYFVALDVKTESALVKQSIGEAQEQGRASWPDRLFCLLRVGAPTMFISQ